MSRHVTRLYLIELVNQAYLNQENNFFFWFKSDCNICQATQCFEEELRKDEFNSDNLHIKKWFIIYLQKHHTIKLQFFP